VSRVACAVVTLAVLVALGTYAWRGWYTRYITDDYCTAITLRDRGFVGAMKYHRQTWSGRYSYYAVKAIPESIGPATARVMPAAMIVLFCAAGFWTFRRLFTRLRSGLSEEDDDSRLLAFMMGVIVVFAAIDGTPEVLAVGGPFVWETGLVTYMLPLVLFTLWAGLFFARFRGRVFVSALLMLVAGGLSETSLAAQGAFTAGILLVCVLLRARDAIPVAAAGFVATLISLLLVVTAPGNIVRMSRLPVQQPFVDAVLDALLLAYRYPGSNMFIGGASLLLVILGGMLVGVLVGATARIRISAALLTAAVLLGAFIATMIPSTWLLSMGPPPRALHVTNFFMIGTLLALSAVFGAARLRNPRAVLIALLVAALVPVYSTVTLIRNMDEGRLAASEMDRIAAIMKANRGRDVSVHSPWALAQRVLVTDPEFFTNRCLADYYGVRSLTVTR
jgi:Family of unknown function (DUF6056)